MFLVACYAHSRTLTNIVAFFFLLSFSLLKGSLVCRLNLVETHIQFPELCLFEVFDSSLVMSVSFHDIEGVISCSLCVDFLCFS